MDHDLPDFVEDGTISIATGETASVDAVHHALDFPAYWDATLRQYLYYDGHNGYDYNLWYQPVYAAATGKVIFARMEYPSEPDHGYGNMIMIEHRGGYVTLYGHLSKFRVRKGQKVRAGQEIGVSGNTGHSSGPHLHFTVFHNCSPTDPYGWTGSGADPLVGYKGETSELLWKQVPDVFNPAPGFPGTLPASDATRLLLLRLPGTTGGTAAFSARLRGVAGRAAAVLRKRHLSVRVDLLRGLLVVVGSAAPESFYSVPGVVSITTPDLVEGARADLLSALADAALVTSHQRIPVARSPKWSGFIVRLQGRAILVGKGQPGREVDLVLQTRRDPARVHRIQAAPKTGAYAVDLGAMSRAQVKTLERQLSGRGTGGTSVRVQQVEQPSPHRAPGRVTRPQIPWGLLAGLLALAVACLLSVPLTLRRRRRA
jgi:hypothetical protein